MMNKIRFFPLFLIILGSIFLADNLGFIENAWGTFWPLMLITFGFSIIYNSIEWK